MTQRNKRKFDSSQSSQTERPSQSVSQLSSNLNELVSKCVRLFLSKMHTKVPIKRAEIMQHVFSEKAGKTFDTVIENTKQVLNETYGLKLLITDGDSSNKRYFVVNNLEHAELIEKPENENFKRNITFLVLTHIFMSRNVSTEESLWEFLEELNITPQTKMSDVDNCHDFITKELVKQQYIILEQMHVGINGEKNKKISWGPQAEQYISKMKTLEFVANVLGVTNVKNWSKCYEDARNQFMDVMDMEE